MKKKTKDGIITASIVIVAAYLLYKIFSKKSNSNSIYGGNGGVVMPNPTLGGTIGSAPTIGDAKFKEIAEKIFSSMDGYGTNVNEINNQISLLKNNDDLMSLIAAYGIRDISSGKYNPLPDFNGNLPEAIANELSQNQISDLNSILVKSGINIRFNSDGQLTTI